MVESSVSSIYRSLPSWEIQVNIEVYSSTFFTHLEVLMIWLYSRVIVLDLWEEKDSKRICLKLKARAMQGNPNQESLKSFLLVESWKFWWTNSGSWALESGIHGVESRIRDCLEFPYMGRQGDALTTDARRNWNSLMTLFYLFGQRY